MITDVSNNLMQQALDHFSNHRWAIVDSAIDPFVYELLNREIEIFIEENLMRESTIGKNRARIAEIRSDFLFWHDPEQFTIAQMMYFDILNFLKTKLNFNFFLSLDSIESHYAFYPVGGHYSAHRDRLRNDDARLISVVFYLNDHWDTSDGGQLILYPEHQETLEIFPKANRMVIFDSQILHEVIITKQPRYSIASWLKIRPQTETF